MISFRLLSAFLASAVLLSSCSRSQESPFEDDLSRLDDVIAMADEYVQMKKQKINTIENLLHSRGVSKLQQYHIYGELYREYEAYQFDLAKDALDNQIRLAEEIGDDTLRNSALIDKAYILTISGYYHESHLLFNQIDTLKLTGSQMVEWYVARHKFLYDYHEYVSASGFTVRDHDKLPYYQNMILNSFDANTYYRRYIEVMSLMGAGKLHEASEKNMDLIGRLEVGSRNYAVQTYLQGRICSDMGDSEDAIYWWVESAVCDIKAAIKDNASLATIATELNSPQDADRAFRYIGSAFEDAVFYNSKLRRVQVASSFPMIEKAYSDSRVRQEKDRRRYTLMLSSVVILLAFFCVLAVRMYLRDRASSIAIKKKNKQLLQYTKSIEEAEETLRKTNLDLTEANVAKEEYLGLFLSMCSGYLDKLKKTLPREQYESELRTFYKTFDTSFLQLYPKFVEDFNALLREEYRIVLKDGELLNTELRIFALIKLGITQSSHIASLLRYSVNTIYNYRAQVKNSALTDRENFEEVVRKIGSKY